MKKKQVNFLLIFAISYIVTGCGPGIANQMVRITPANASTPIQAAQCAAQQSGWNVTFKDEQSLSAAKTVGMANVPLSLNVAIQSKDGSASKAAVTVYSPRGEGQAGIFQNEFLKAFRRCGDASAAIM